MAVTKYFSKIPLPTPKDFPHIPKNNFHPISLASEGIDWANPSEKGESRLWLIMGAYGKNKKGKVGPMYPTFLFYSNDRGTNWTQIANLPEGVEFFSGVQTGADGSVIFIDQFSNKKHLGIYRFFTKKGGLGKWKRLLALYDPVAIAWNDSAKSLYAAKDSTSKTGGEKLHQWFGAESFDVLDNDPDVQVKFKSLDFDGWRAVGNCSMGDDNFRYTPINIGGGKAFYMPVTLDVDFAQVLLNQRKDGSDHYGVTEEGQLLKYEGESLFLPVTLEEVVADPKSEMGANYPIEEQVLRITDTRLGHLCMITTKAEQKVVKKHKYMHYTNTAWMGVPKPVEVKP